VSETCKIGCPVCGAVLKVATTVGVEEKNVSCPVCHTSSPYKNFKPIIDKAEQTLLGGAAEKTFAEAIGCLVAPSLGQTFPLKAGRNIVGRQSAQSLATIQLPFPPSHHRTSREHLVFDVKHVEGRGMVHYASLFKPDTNATFIGEAKLHYGDSVILNDEDIIRLPDMELRFEIHSNIGADA